VLHVGGIGCAPLPALDDVAITLVDAIEAGQRLPRRLRRSHKGTYGRTLVIGGSAHYTGAPYLAASAAYRVGAGLVTVAAPDSIVSALAGMLPEATWLPLPHDQGSLNAAAASALRDDLDAYPP
jgi:NAD(P)H-hydrate epimerase